MRRHRLSSSNIFVFLSTVAFLASLSCCCQDSNSVVTRKDDFCAMRNGGVKRVDIINPGGLWRRERRRLGGLGSSPPRCTGRCGDCSPCKPAHVAVPPGTAVVAEYYPEAWRCKCGNKLYMP